MNNGNTYIYADSTELTYLASTNYIPDPLTSYIPNATDLGVSPLQLFFEILDTDQGGTVSLVEFTSAFKTIGQRLGKCFIYPNPISLFGQIDAKQQGFLVLQDFMNASCLNEDQSFIQILLALDAVTEGSLGGIYKNMHGQQELIRSKNGGNRPKRPAQGRFSYKSKLGRM